VGRRVGDWIEIPDGKGWVLLKDQFGIRLTHKDPNAWKIGEMKGIDLATGNAKQLAAGEIRTVEWLRERGRPRRPCGVISI
jgi:hypothetical protein